MFASSGEQRGGHNRTGGAEGEGVTLAERQVERNSEEMRYFFKQTKSQIRKVDNIQNENTTVVKQCCNK